MYGNCLIKSKSESPISPLLFCLVNSELQVCYLLLHIFFENTQCAIINVSRSLEMHGCKKQLEQVDRVIKCRAVVLF